MSPPRSELLDEAYPEALRHAELAAVTERRRISGTPDDAPLVGVALSGGGIRSATFCLGLFQSLARHSLIRRIDFLSTVSGGGYFGSFLGAAFTRDRASPDSIERELSDNQSWSVRWLRDNGRFLSPNGSGDTWTTAAVALRNWCAVHVVLLTFGFLLFGLGALVRTNLVTSFSTSEKWREIEEFLWGHTVLGLWWSPWILLPALSLAVVMIPSGFLYWVTQSTGLMKVVHAVASVVRRRAGEWSEAEFTGRAQDLLTRTFMTGLALTVVFAVFALIDSLGQTFYFGWSSSNFAFPSEWLLMTSAGAGSYAFSARIFVWIQDLLGKRKLRISFDLIALGLSLVWLLLIFVALSVLACGFAWNWGLVWDSQHLQLMTGGWKLFLAVGIAFFASWIFSRSFAFVNLSSMQQIYAARLRRAYIGATNPKRQYCENYSMTDLMPGDDLGIDEYRPHQRGGPLHFLNVTINETLSGKTQIERRDRKGLIMAVGPLGLSVGSASHALWDTSENSSRTRFRLLRQSLWEDASLKIAPIPLREPFHFHALHANVIPRSRAPHQPSPPQRVEALSLGRWVALSGAAFTTGLGAGTKLGLSLLLGLGNVRLGYWWNSGIKPEQHGQTTRPTFVELGARVINFVLPVQTCLLAEFFARFHGPARQHWYLSDGGHFENTACYELIRRRVPFIVCSDAGQDQHYRFDDLANLVRIARTDFGAEIQIARRKNDSAKDDPDVKHPMPLLEDIVHPDLLDVIGSPDDFSSLASDDEDSGADDTPRHSKRHALLARIHYLDTDKFSWLLLIKPSLMGDESIDVLQYQRTHPAFPQEPTSDQYFDEAQWESYRKLGEHIGAELFTRPKTTASGWSPSDFSPPVCEEC